MNTRTFSRAVLGAALLSSLHAPTQAQGMMDKMDKMPMDGMAKDGMMMPGMMMPGAMAPSFLMPGAAMAGAKMFRVTITNLTGGQILSPPILVTHSAALRLWQMGQKASFGVQRVAEEGNFGPLLAAALMQNGGKEVGSVATGFGIMPGQSASLLISADPKHPLLSGVTMLGRTNDGFTGVDSVNLMEMTAARSFDVMGYDAGTEKNNERASHLVALMGSERDAENSAIAMHKGIRGDKDAPKTWNFSGAVARISIAPASDAEMSAAKAMNGAMMKGMTNGPRLMMMMPDGRTMSMKMEGGKMMVMDGGMEREMMMKDGMMPPANMTGAKMMMAMPDGTSREVKMMDGKMMLSNPDGTMTEVRMSDQ